MSLVAIYHKQKGGNPVIKQKREFRKKIHLKQILQSRNTKAEIEIGTTIEYDVRLYQVKNTIVNSTEV